MNETFVIQNPTYAYVGAFVDELRRSGLLHVVICPGSRSTPLALTFAACSQIRCWMHVDERSAAFFALGLAKRLAQPVALLCTSGTASANFLPAIVEAHLTHVPLLVLTTDRPPELRDCGAPQAIDQNRLYGTHVKWYMETILPEASNETLRYIRTIACRALAHARTAPAGPVHLNLPFREPLTPAPLPDQPLPPEEQRDPLAWRGRAHGEPYTIVAQSSVQETRLEDTLEGLVEEIATTPRGLIIVGPQTETTLVGPLLQLARTSGYPILADPLSQLRGLDVPVISSYDAFLRNEHFLTRYAPQIVLRFGAIPTSKPLQLYLKRYAATCKQVLVEARDSWEDPAQLAAQLFYTDARSFCRKVCKALDPLEYQLEQEERSRPPDSPLRRARMDWAETWGAAEHAVREALSSAIGQFTEFFEGRIFTELAEALLPTDLLYVGNSMPVRDMDTFFWPCTSQLTCLGNRGANGIDGVVSSALGASAANESTRAVLVIGDLSFYHDLNGLLAAKLHHLNLTIILANNNGGGIFSFLPQAAYPEHFEQLFGTPTSLDFRPVVEMYGGSFQRVTNWDEFRQDLRIALDEGGLHVIEVPTERASNVTMHRQLWQVVEEALCTAHLLGESEA